MNEAFGIVMVAVFIGAAVLSIVFSFIVYDRVVDMSRLLRDVFDAVKMEVPDE